MSYRGSWAYDMTAMPERVPERDRGVVVDRPFELVDGGGLDARARRGVSHTLLLKARAVLVATVVLVVLGAARVGISVATVDLLQENSSLATQIDDAKTLSDELLIERAVLASNSRISRIATQNYGMVLTSESVTVTLPVPVDEDALAAPAAEGTEGELEAQAEFEPETEAGLAAEAEAESELETAPEALDGDAAQEPIEDDVASDLT